MATDMIGNKLKVGDLVRIEIPKNLFGRVIAIQDGGTIIASGLRGKLQSKEIAITPGKVTVSIVTDTVFDPSSGVCGEMLVCVDPRPDEEKKPESKIQLT